MEWAVGNLLKRDWSAADGIDYHKEAKDRLGKMVAKFGIKDIIAVYSPDLDEFALWTPENIKGLEGDDPLAVFDHELHAAADKTSSTSDTPAGAEAGTQTPKASN